MKYIFYILSLFVFVSCSGVKLEQTPIQTIAPTVVKPIPPKKVDMDLERSVKPIEESSKAIGDELAKAQNIGLEMKLELEKTTLDIVVIKDYANKLNESNAFLVEFNKKQGEDIDKLKFTLNEKAKEVNTLQEAFNSSLQSIDVANERIERLTKSQETITKERDKAIIAYAESDGKIQELQKQKRRYFIWAVSLSVAIVAYVAIRLYG